MSGRRAAVLTWCFSLAVLLSAVGHVTGQGAVSPAHMKMQPFEPAFNSHLPQSEVLAELTTASACACQQACLARHDCLSASTSKKVRETLAGKAENANGATLIISDDGYLPEFVLREVNNDAPPGELVSDELVCRLGRRRGHPTINLVDSTSQFWERLGRSQLGDHCKEFSDCLTAGAVCHSSTCQCAAGQREDGSCHCRAGAGAGEPCWFRTCAEVRSAGVSEGGVYLLRHPLLDGTHREFQVRCEMKQADRGWTVIQARDMTIDNGGNFNRPRQEYLEMFGNLNDNYWLGLRRIREIIEVNGGQQVLGIALQDASGKWDHAIYNNFNLDSEKRGFTMRVDGYDQTSGSLGSGIVSHHGRKFSTYDADYDTSDDENCAQLLGGGWWYHNCRGVSLNGMADASREYRPGAIYWPGREDRNFVKSLMMLGPQEPEAKRT